MTKSRILFKINLLTFCYKTFIVYLITVLLKDFLDILILIWVGTCSQWSVPKRTPTISVKIVVYPLENVSHALKKE